MSTPALTPAASVILLRGGSPTGAEVLLMRRQMRGTWADAFVFPGGKLEPQDGGPEQAALRELLEEAGVLLTRAAPPDPAALAALREQLIAGADFAALLATVGAAPAPEQLVPWARWQTPALEARRFDAWFYVAILPPGQEGSCHAHEHVEHRWVAPRAALDQAAAGNLRLPPPQLRTMWELDQALGAGGDPATLLAAARARAPHVLPLMPRAVAEAGERYLVLPWDHAFAGAAPADPHEPPAWPAGHPLAVGPSRVAITAGVAPTAPSAQVLLVK